MIRNRRATRAELDLILGWARAEGWNPGLDDAEAFYAADPEGFFVAVDEADRAVAAISVVNHSADFAFLGLYIVAPEHRGKGIGYALWQHALEHAGARTVGLDGVEAQQDNYAASGFAYASATTRFSGDIIGATFPDIRIATAEEIETLIALEARASGILKPAYLRCWLAGSPTRTTLVSRSDSGITGMCTVRACARGCKIGPLVAETSEVAARLMRQAATLCEGPVTIDVPAPSTGLAGTCQAFGMSAGFKTARMYRGPLATASAHQNFAVTSLELG